MNSLDKQYTDLLQTILEHGVEKKDRTGTGTKSIFGYTIRHNMKDGFPLLTTKKMPFKTIVTELIWFLRGDTNIKYLVDNNCHIWNGDAYKNYQKNMAEWFDDSQILTMDEFINKIKTDDEFTNKWGELGPIYGKQWRKWRGQDGMIGEKDENGTRIVTWNQIDQIQNLINDLKTNPDSRRLMVNSWNVGEISEMVLPPCHYGFQVYTRELGGEERWDLLEKRVGKELFDSWVSEIVPFGGGLSEYLQSYDIPKRAISLMFNMRSNDVPLGLPFNIASYALLLEIIGKMVNMITEELIINLGDVHIYKNQVDGVKEQLTREPFELPKLVMSNQINFNDSVDEFLNSCLITDFIVENYQSHPTIKIPLSN
jgi:thymidylate synthase